MRKQTIFSLLVFSLAFLAGYFVYSKIKTRLSQKENIFPITHLKDEGPSMTINGFKLEETKGDKIQFVLAANQAKMFKDKGEILFETVNTQIYNEDSNSKKDSYTIKSNQGKYYTKEDKISLEGKVGLQTSDGYYFSTESIVYKVPQKKMQTDLPIAVKGKSQKGDKIYIQGVGLNGDVSAGDFNVSQKALTKIGKSLEVKSDRAMVNTKNSTAVFIDNIIAKKDKIDIKGDKLEVSYTKDGEVNDIDVTGDVKLKTGKKIALCDNAVIKGNSNEVVLTGKPELHMGEDIMVGERIIFFTDNDEVFVERVKADVSQRGYKK